MADLLCFKCSKVVSISYLREGFALPHFPIKGKEIRMFDENLRLHSILYSLG